MQTHTHLHADLLISVQSGCGLLWRLRPGCFMPKHEYGALLRCGACLCFLSDISGPFPFQREVHPGVWLFDLGWRQTRPPACSIRLWLGTIPCWPLGVEELGTEHTVTTHSISLFHSLSRFVSISFTLFERPLLSFCVFLKILCRT